MRWLAIAVGTALSACASGEAGPAVIDTRNDTCSFCRMAISDVRFAAQIVAPHEEPVFFDDIGCFASYVKAQHPREEAIAYVADHRTRQFVRAARATYTKVSGHETPMASRLIAHADAASRDADPDARGGAPQTLAEVFGPAGPPAGGK